jgi:NarL family two-component system response regulator LiaR
MWSNYVHERLGSPRTEGSRLQGDIAMDNVTAATARPIARVLIVDDHDLVRVGLRAVMGDQLDEHLGIEWCEATNLEDAIGMVGSSNPGIDLVLLDLNLADSKGLQGLRQMRAKHPQANVAIMSGTHDEFVIGQARAMGAMGYVPKTGSPETTRTRLSQLIRQAKQGGPGATPSARTRESGNFPTVAPYDRIAELGPRHLEILELVLSGCSNQEISNATTLSLGTVKNYVSTILLALDVKSRSHLISLFR